MREARAVELVAQVGVRVHPQEAETFVREACALALEDRDGHGVVAAEQDGDVGQARDGLSHFGEVGSGVADGDVAQIGHA